MVNYLQFLECIKSIDGQDGSTFEFNTDVKISPKGSFVFISSENATELYVYKRNSGTGILTFASKKVVPQSHFTEFAMSNDERFLYGASFNLYKAFVVYQMDKQTGIINEIQQFAHPSYRDYTSAKFLISPNNKFIYAIGEDVYASDQSQTQITIYDRNPNTGLISYKTHYTNLKK